MEYQWEKEERRHYIRIEKHFIISYYDKSDPDVRHDVSQLKNISLGGMCFITSQQFAPSTKMGIELKTPFLTDALHISGTILESRTKIPHLIFEARLVFDPLNSEAEEVIKKIIELFSKILKENKA